MKLVDSNPTPQVTGLNELAGKVNYLIGDEPEKWRTDIPTYAKVQYQNVYPGVDLVYYGNQRQLEYDFVVAPGADPRAINLRFEGADRISVDDAGDLVLRLAGGEARFHKPVIYQLTEDGERNELAGGYTKEPV